MERKQKNNYYFENKDLCEEVGTYLLSIFYNPMSIACNLEEYLSKTDLILKKSWLLRQ